jgi:hypothetical protein
MAYFFDYEYLTGNTVSSKIFNKKKYTLYSIDQHVYANSQFTRSFPRSFAKDGFSAFHCLSSLFSRRKLHFEDKHRVGIYTAFQNGPLIYETLNKIKSIDEPMICDFFKKRIPPKQHFKQNAPLRATHFSIFLQNHGPQYCFTNPNSCLEDAISAAKIDLDYGEVDTAVIISAFSFEDLQTFNYFVEQTQYSEIYESAVCILLSNKGFDNSAIPPLTSFSPAEYAINNYFFQNKGKIYD